MAEEAPSSGPPQKQQVELDEEEDISFEQIGLDARLVRALLKKGIQKPTPIQRVGIPLILEGKDVVARAKTGSGKTFAYLLPLLHNLLSGSDSGSGQTPKLGPSSFVLVPTRELCHQVYLEVVSLIELCRAQLKVVEITSSMSHSELKTALSGPPDVLVSTPACLHTCLSSGVLQPNAIQESLSMLVLDEADLLLSYGYEDDVRALTTHIPRRCQCLLMSATSSADVEKLKKLILHNPYILTLPEVTGGKEEIIPKNVQQFFISCGARDKFVYFLALLKLELIQKKVLIFTNTTDMGYRLRLFLEQFAMKSVVLHNELAQNSRLHALEEFNAGLFDYLIATDESQSDGKEAGEKNDEGKKSKRRKFDAEFGLVRGIDFKNVHTVINFEMPQSAARYVHRIGRTGRAFSTGASVTLVSTDEMEGFEELKSELTEDASGETSFIAPFPLLTTNAVESLRYRAEDVWRSVTKIAVREARAQDFRKELINSAKLKKIFDANPKDLDLLKHDQVLSKKTPPEHLRDTPDYMLDTTTQEIRKNVKLAQAAMGNRKSGPHRGPKKNLKKSLDPLKALSNQRPNRSNQKKKRKNEDW